MAFGSTDGGTVPVYHLPAESVLASLNVNPRKGLTDEQVLLHGELYGSNALPVDNGKPWWKILWSNVFNIITCILLGCFVITVVFKEWIDAATVMGIIVFNTLIGFISEMRSAAALDALKQMSKGESTGMFLKGSFYCLILGHSSFTTSLYLDINFFPIVSL